MSYQGYFYGASGQQIYPTPRESPGKYKARPVLNREVKRSISQYDHAELVSVSASLCCRIPALRASIRDKNSWSFANWIPIYMGEDEKWGEAAEEYLIHEVLPNALFRELRKDFAWGMRISGMGLDMHGDDLAIFTEDEYHNPKIDIVPSPRIGSGIPGMGWSNSVFSGAMASMRADGQGTVMEGAYKGLPIYNGMIRRSGVAIAVRVCGFDDTGKAMFSDIPLDSSVHYACECEFFGQGRPVPRVSASVLHFMLKEEIDDQLMKGLRNAAVRSVIHKLPPGKDASMAGGNPIQQTTFQETNAAGAIEEKTIWVEYSGDGNVQYIGADEELSGITFDNPSTNAEAFAVRVLMECLSDLGWSYELLDSSSTGRAPTRLVTQKANNSIAERQSIQESRSIQFFQHAIGKGMAAGRIPKNYNGVDPYKWAIGFPASVSIDQGNDVTASLNRLKMGLTNVRIESAKEGNIGKHILKQRKKEIAAIMDAADAALKYAHGKGHTDMTYQQAMELFYQPNPNSSAVAKMNEEVTNPAQPGAKPTPQQK